MTITLKELIEWRDALEPVSHISQTIAIDGATLDAGKSVKLMTAHVHLNWLVAELSQPILVDVTA